MKDKCLEFLTNLAENTSSHPGLPEWAKKSSLQQAQFIVEYIQKCDEPLNDED